MKKKIKDLTLEECKKICNEHFNCSDCPLMMVEMEDRYLCYWDKVRIDKAIKTFDLESEVEVDELRFRKFC